MRCFHVHFCLFYVALSHRIRIPFSAAASEALYVTGDFTRLAELSDGLRARSFEDKLNIHNNLVRALAASGKFEDGIAKCVHMLSQLDECIPTDITAEVYALEVAQVKQLLHGKSRQELLSLPKMVETQKLVSDCNCEVECIS